MFTRRKIKWFGSSLVALIVSVIFYLFAKMFLRGIEKQAGVCIKKPKQKKTK